MKNFPIQYTILALFFTVLISTTLFGKTTLSVQPVDELNHKLTLNIQLQPGDFVYKDYLTLSVDHPDVTLSEWYTSSEPVDHYDPDFKETKKILNKNFSITAHIATKKTDIADAYLHVSSYRHKKKKIMHNVFPLALNKTTQIPTDEQANNPAPISAATQKEKPVADAQTSSWSSYISLLITTSESLWLRTLLALLLGILLSLTPCIYPMIPITVGILQSQASTSFARNFLLAIAYTAGIACTFALLGLIAAFTGSMFGNFMSNPFVILSIVAMLLYLSGSMLGLYEMYIPSFFQPKNSNLKGSSLFSVFLFGAASGTVASPCLSPGLVLLLTLVTTLGNKLLGFTLLFSFGIGLSLPLLLIGTFSSSLSLLPQAGMWMIEIKKVFGFMLIGMCFYFLKPFVPWYLLLWTFSAFIMSTGIFYLFDAKNPDAAYKQAKNIFGSMLVTLSILLYAQSIKATLIKRTITQKQNIWLTDYQQALERAKLEKRKIVLDLSAPFCSLCKAIEKKHFTDQTVIHTLQELVPVKIANADDTNETIVALRKKFNIVGVPTLLIIDPETETELARWAGELYDESPATFAEKLAQYT